MVTGRLLSKASTYRSSSIRCDSVHAASAKLAHRHRIKNGSGVLELKCIVHIRRISHKSYLGTVVYFASVNVYWTSSVNVGLVTMGPVSDIAYRVTMRPLCGIRKHFAANQRSRAQIFSRSEFVVAQKQLGAQMEEQSP
jgi:hypothetical protein